MVFKNAISSLKKWWAEYTMSADERWLSQSADVVELEKKLRQIWNPNYNNFRKLGGIK